MEIKPRSSHRHFYKALIILKKSLRVLFEVGGSVLAFVLVILALLLGRLSMGPINLDYFKPEIEASFRAPQAEISATVEHVQLVWREWKRPLEIELVNVHLQKGQNHDWLKIAHIGVSLRLIKLITGDVSLKNLRLYKPHVLLEKDGAGEFTLGFGEARPDNQFTIEALAPFLALGSSQPSLGKLNELEKISIIDAHILLKDDKENQEWTLPKVTFILKRRIDGFLAEMKLSPQNGKGSLTLGMVHHLKAAQSDFYADFHHVSFRDIITEERMSLTSSSPEELTVDDILHYLHHWNIPIHGKLNLTLSRNNQHIVKGVGKINIGKGELDLSAAKLLPLPVSSGQLAFSIAENNLTLDAFSLTSDKMTINLSGKAGTPLTGDKTFELNGQIDHLPLDHLSALWPKNLAQHARTWLTQNLRVGTLTKGTFSLKVHRTGEETIVDDLQGTLEGEGATITYLKGLPPATDVKAQAKFDLKGFDIKLISGKLQGIALQKGRVLISNLDTNNEALSLDISAAGSLSDVLDVLDHKPLQYASYGGIDPKKVQGTGKVDLHMNFPLLSNLQFKDVKLTLKGAFQKVALNRKISDDLTAQVTGGDFAVNLNQDQMVINGSGILNQMPSQLSYIHYFKSTAPQELRIDVDTNASFEDFKRFGFDFQDYGRGPTRAKLTYIMERSKHSHLTINLDTTAAYLVFPPLEWEKKPGEQGNISFALLFKNGDLFEMSNLTMVTPTYSLQGNILFGPHKKWSTIQLSQFKGPHTNVAVTLHTPQDNIYELSFIGESIDLEKFQQYIAKEENATDHPPTDIKISAQVGQLRLGEGKTLQNVEASANLFLYGRESTWKAVKLRAKAGKSVAYSENSAVTNVAGGIAFDITPGPNDTRTLEVRANDAGKVLKTLDIYNDVKEGYIVIKAQRVGNGPYAGIFRLRDFNVNRVPVLARFAALLSPIGIVNLLSEKGTLSMDRFECEFQFGENAILVKKGVGKSLSLGFTVEGRLDHTNRRYALKGNIIPVRFINSILGNIPIIGDLLNGGEGEGIFGIAYTVSGGFDDPRITLNPLSILAPGFLRKLFQSLGDE